MEVNVLQHIKELEKEAKQAKYWRERYEELRVAIKEVLNPLNNIMDVKVKVATRHYNTKNSEIGEKRKELAEVIYKKMMTEDVQVSTKDIRKMLNDTEDFCCSVQKITEFLRLKKGVNERREGKRIFFFYRGQKRDDDSELLKMIPKKISFKS